MPFQKIQTGRFHLYHCIFLVAHVTARFSEHTFFGREKGVCDQTPKASADLSDFLKLTLVSTISASLAGRNLHLVIPQFRFFRNTGSSRWFSII